MEDPIIVVDDVKATNYALKRVQSLHHYHINEEDFEHDCKVILNYMSFEEVKTHPANIFSYAGAHHFRMHINPSMWHIYVSLNAYYWDLGLIECEKPTTKEEYLDALRHWIDDQYFEYLKKQPISNKELLTLLKSKPLPSEIMVEEKYASIFEHSETLNNVSEPIDVISTGFDALDQLTTGLHKSDLIVIGAHPANGKTAMLVSMACHIAMKQRIPIGILSLELSEEELARRFMMNVAMVESTKLRSGDLDTEERTRVNASLSTLSNSPIFVDDTPQPCLDEVRTKAESMVRNHHVQCILLDYVQLINEFCLDRSKNLSILRAIKQLAVDLNITIILFSQARTRIREHLTPNISEFRKEIYESSDLFVMLYRPEYYNVYEDEDGNDLHGILEVLVAKNNHGSIGKVRLHFTPRLAKIV